MENKVRNFQYYFEIEFFSSPKINEKLYSFHIYFFDIWLQKLSCVVTYHQVTVNYYFYQSFKKYLFIINLFTSLVQMKLFLQNNIAFTNKCTL